MAPRTIAKYLARVSALFEWAFVNDYIVSNPARKLSVRVEGESEQRKPFSSDDIQRLLTGDIYVEGNRAERFKFWLPLLGLFTGARLGELAQLQPADVRQERGIWLIAINDSGDKRVKTPSSRRLTPIHPTLIDLGFLRFVNRMQRLGEERLFPELRKGNRSYGHSASKWFGKYRKRCGVTDKGKVFHSFRHTLTDNLKQQGVPEEHSASIVGHAKEGITYRVYGQEYNVEFKRDLILRLRYNVDMNHLFNPRVNPYLGFPDFDG